MPQIHLDILSGRRDHREIPKRLDIGAVTLTADNKLVLMLRPEHLDPFPTTWGIPGEAMHPVRDRETNSTFSAMSTVRACVEEEDELALQGDLAATDYIRFIALATEWEVMFINLIAIVRLRSTAQELRSYYASFGGAVGEARRFDFIEFQFKNMLDLVVNGAHEAPGAAYTRAPINTLSCFAILTALFHEFGFHDVLYRIS